MIEVTIEGQTRGPLFPATAGVTCCGVAAWAVKEAGPIRGYACPTCGARYSLIVSVPRRVRG